MELRRAIIFARDFDRLLSFYRDQLGLRPLPESAQAGWAELDAGGVTIGIHAIPAAIAKDLVIDTPPSPRAHAAIKLVFQVKDLHAERARLQAAGVSLGEILPWNACDGVDPEGNVFQLVQS